MSGDGMTDEMYDYVVVGAGSAGCVVASRLSEDPAVRVLLLEAGGWDRDPLIGIPVGISEMTRKKLYRWNDFSEPDAGLNGRKNYLPHGKVIGGGSSINYMAHTRCHPADYDGWARDGATGWSFDKVFPFFKETETWEHGDDGWRGGKGALGAQAGKMDDPVYNAWFAACRSLGHKISDDHNGKEPEGVGILQYTIRNGRRTSSAKAFLHPALNRRNLTVRTESLATRILFKGRVAVGVEYLSNGHHHQVRARQTVLCLGAINTPQLLMLSGVGPAEHLRSFGVPIVADLPVGKNLQDHLAYSMIWKRKQTGTFHRSLRLDRAAFNMARSMLFRSGPSSRLPGVIMAFLKSKSTLSQPDLQFLMQIPAPDADVWFPGVKKPFQDVLHTRVQLMQPDSRGEILLKTLDPTDRPRVFYNSLSVQSDLDALISGYKMVWAIGNAPALSDYRGAPLYPEKKLMTDAEIEAFIRAEACQQYHPAGSCRMGSDDRAVVNPDLSVRGVDGLRVVDASVMPRIISGNPNVPIMMMAAKAAAMWQGKI